MTRNKKRDGESSLELLLDTMCNTFGGVMFIAIALVVLMAMLSPIRKEADSVKKNKEKWERLQQLQQELSDLSQDNRQLEEMLKKLENDPRKELISELIRLEEQKQKNRLALSIEEKRNNLVRCDALKFEQKEQQIRRQMQAFAEKREEREKRLQELERKIASAKKNFQKISQQNMSFRVMEKSQKSFYALIVWKDMIWRVGPERNDAKNDFVPNDACSFQETTLDMGRNICCMPIEGKGIPILKNGSVSPEIVSLLKNIPPDRIPLFSLAKDSITSFAELRKYMKEAHILHGIDTSFETRRNFAYVLVNEKKDLYYEY